MRVLDGAEWVRAGSVWCRQVQVRLGTEELSVYGEVKGNRPTGVVSFELRVVLPYVGKVYLGDACMGELIGYINVPAVSPATLEQVRSEEQQQDWVLIGLQGGRARPLAACGVATC